MNTIIRPLPVIALALLSTLSACAHDNPQRTAPVAAMPAPEVPAATQPSHGPLAPEPQAAPAAEAGGARDATASGADRPSAPPDREQPIHIKADRIEINQKKSTTTYIGRVVLTQGGLRINAARVEASYKVDKIDTIVAHGKPVTLYQRSETAGQDLHASALRLEYHAIDSRADLFGEVRLQQGTNSILCNTLHYDLAENTLSAEGDGADNRVTMTIESTAIKKPVGPKAAPGTPKRSRP